MQRYCIARDGKKWRVYDDVEKRFAEPMGLASDKSKARERARLWNAGQMEQGAA